MNSVYGSEWRKWDFHVHTPYSILNNQFGINASDDSNTGFDRYVQQLFSKAIEKDIWAIGITDYFSIDGYKRIHNDYLNNPTKMAELFPDDGARERIGQMLVFPNIEFRLNQFVHREDNCDPIGYHVLFSDEVNPEEIEENFLQKLQCAPDFNQSWTLTHRNIKQLGDTARKLNNCRGDSYKLGLENVTIKYEDALQALRECQSFDGRSIVAIPVDETLCKADWNRSYFSKRALYGQCHCYMTSSPTTRAWALSEDRISEFGSIKPCIWGSDAHSFDRLFEPDEKRYCWVKADLTFEGLMQILCEPADRIAIQEDRPEQHDHHRSIKSIQFHEESFQEEPICFSEGLTCIIGGRSTGKSLLLRQLARSISPDYAIEQEQRSSVNKLDFNCPADVVWRDGSLSGERKIIYLPQTYLNRTVDDPESGETGASDLIAGVLLQNKKINEAKQRFDVKKGEILKLFSDNLAAYADCQGRLKAVQVRLAEHGESSIYREAEQALVEEYKSLLGPGNASQEDIELYDDLKRHSNAVAGLLEALKRDKAIIESLSSPIISEPVYNGSNCYGLLTEEAAAELRVEIDSINETLRDCWATAIQRLVNACVSREKEKEETINEIGRQIVELEPKIEHSDKLYKTMASLNEERKKLVAAETIEREIDHLRNDQDLLFDSICATRNKLFEAYVEFSKEIEPLSASTADGLDFSAEVVWRKKDFESSVINMLDRRKLGAFERATNRDLQNLADEDYCDELLLDIWNSIKGKLDGWSADA